MEESLLEYGCAPLHECMRSRETIIRAAANKKAALENKSAKDALKEICVEIRKETGATLFVPEPEKKGNSNTGVNLKTVTKESHKTASILKCSTELLDKLDRLLEIVESTQQS